MPNHGNGVDGDWTVCACVCVIFNSELFNTVIIELTHNNNVLVYRCLSSMSLLIDLPNKEKESFLKKSSSMPRGVAETLIVLLSYVCR